MFTTSYPSSVGFRGCGCTDLLVAMAFWFETGASTTVVLSIGLANYFIVVAADIWLG